MSRAYLIFGAMVVVLAIPQSGRAHNNGALVVGHSGATGALCNVCHNGGTAPSVVLSGPATLTAGATGQYTLTVTSKAATDKIGGVDIAVSNSAAQLTPVSTTVQASGGEIVHKAAIPMSGGVVSVQLSLKAPATNGPLTLYAAGLAGDAVDAPAGKLSAATTLAITVTGGVVAGPVDGGTDGPHDLATGTGTGTTSPTGTGGNDAPPPMSGGCSLTRGSAAAGTVPPAFVMLSLTALGLLRRRRH